MVNNATSIVMMGASGAVGTQVLQTLLDNKNIKKLTLLGRKPMTNVKAEVVQQHVINIFDSVSYTEFLPQHDIAICPLGVGQSSKASKEEFLKIDKEAVINFAIACKKAGVSHFQLLAATGINSKSSSLIYWTNLPVEAQEVWLKRAHEMVAREQASIAALTAPAKSPAMYGPHAPAKMAPAPFTYDSLGEDVRRALSELTKPARQRSGSPSIPTSEYFNHLPVTERQSMITIAEMQLADEQARFRR